MAAFISMLRAADRDVKRFEKVDPNTERLG
jgi:hypothetical protein